MNYQALYEKAAAAGHAAATARTPTPMVVRGMFPEAGPVLASLTVHGAEEFGKAGPGVKEWYESEGACGFAWITTPGTSGFAKWARAAGKARSQSKGTVFWVGDYGQSVDRKAAYADAFAKVLNENGIKAYADSRLD